MHFVPPIAVIGAQELLDGGTIVLSIRDSLGAIQQVRLVQAVDLDRIDNDWLPGRLYIDTHLVGRRSAEEQLLLTSLSVAPIEVEYHVSDPTRLLSPVHQQMLRERCERLRSQVITFVESDAYIQHNSDASEAL